MTPRDLPDPPDQADGSDPPELFVRHVHEWVGGWPPADPVRVVANPRRALPGWDGAISPVAGVVDPAGAAVVGLPPPGAVRVQAFPGHGRLPDLMRELPRLLGSDGVTGLGVMRWSTAPAPLPDAGVWVPADDPRVPGWLTVFGGEVLVVLDGDTYVAGVGVKRHDAFVHELAVGTEEQARGRGLARRLVAQAARRVLDEGRLPTYLHDPANTASARAARAAGFPDRGWRVLGLFGPPSG